MCHSTPSYFTPYLFFVAKVLNFALRLSYPIFATIVAEYILIQFHFYFLGEPEARFIDFQSQSYQQFKWGSQPSILQRFVFPKNQQLWFYEKEET